MKQHKIKYKSILSETPTTHPPANTERSGSKVRVSRRWDTPNSATCPLIGPGSWAQVADTKCVQPVASHGPSVRLPAPENAPLFLSKAETYCQAKTRLST